MKTSLLIPLLCFLSASCFAAGVTIYNDSPFPLTATVMSADGNTKGTVTIAPQQQSSWLDPSPPNEVYSQTPYTVIFKCKNGKPFGVTSGINQGAWVTAMQAQGPRFCEPEKKPPTSQQAGG